MTSTRSRGQPRPTTNSVRLYCTRVDSGFLTIWITCDCRTYTIASRSRWRGVILDAVTGTPLRRSALPAFILHLRGVRGRAQRFEHHRAEEHEEPASTGRGEAVPARRRGQRQVRRGGSHPAVSACASAPAGEPPRRGARGAKTEKEEAREDGGG